MTPTHQEIPTSAAYPPLSSMSSMSSTAVAGADREPWPAEDARHTAAMRLEETAETIRAELDQARGQRAGLAADASHQEKAYASALADVDRRIAMLDAALAAYDGAQDARGSGGR